MEIAKKCSHPSGPNSVFCNSCHCLLCPACVTFHAHCHILDMDSWLASVAKELAEKRAQITHTTYRMDEQGAEFASANSAALDRLDGLRTTSSRRFQAVSQVCSGALERARAAMSSISHNFAAVQHEAHSRVSQAQDRLAGFAETLERARAGDPASIREVASRAEEALVVPVYTPGFKKAKKKQERVRNRVDKMGEKLREVAEKIDELIDLCGSSVEEDFQSDVEDEEETKATPATSIGTLCGRTDSLIYRLESNQLYLYDVKARKECVRKIDELDYLIDYQSILVGTSIFVCGGTYYPAYSDEAYTIDLSSPTTPTSRRASMGFKRNRHALAQVGSRFVYCVGGYHISVGVLDVCERYDLRVDRWVRIKNLNSPTLGASACTINDQRILVLSDIAAWRNEHSVETLDVTEEELGWTRVPLLQTGALSEEIGAPFVGVQISPTQTFILDGLNNLTCRLDVYGLRLKLETLIEGRAIAGIVCEQPQLRKGRVYVLNNDEVIHEWNEAARRWRIMMGWRLQDHQQ